MGTILKTLVPIMTVVALVLGAIACASPTPTPTPTPAPTPTPVPLRTIITEAVAAIAAGQIDAVA